MPTVLWSLPALVSCGGDGDPVGPVASGPMQLMITSISPSDITNGVIGRGVNINGAAVGLWASYLQLLTDPTASLEGYTARVLRTTS